MSKPKPVPKELVCSECGLDWDEDAPHKSQSDCIEALKAELDSRPSSSCRCYGHCHGHCRNCNCYWYSYPNWTWTGTSGFNTGMTYSFTNTSQPLN